MGGGSLLHILVTVVSNHSYIDPHIHSHAAEGLACKTTFVFFWGARVKGGQLQALKQSQHAAIGHSRSRRRTDPRDDILAWFNHILAFAQLYNARNCFYNHFSFAYILP